MVNLTEDRQVSTPHSSGGHAINRNLADTLHLWIPHLINQSIDQQRFNQSIANVCVFRCLLLITLAPLSSCPYSLGFCLFSRLPSTVETLFEQSINDSISQSQTFYICISPVINYHTTFIYDKCITSAYDLNGTETTHLYMWIFNQSCDSLLRSLSSTRSFVHVLSF